MSPQFLPPPQESRFWKEREKVGKKRKKETEGERERERHEIAYDLFSKAEHL